MKEQADPESRRAAMLIVASLLGGVLLLSAIAAQALFASQFHSGILAMLAAILLGTPLILQALRDLWEGQTQMNELVALGTLAAFAAGEYLTAGSIAFFMVISTLIENRTAMGARKTIESLIRLSPRKAVRVENGQEIEVDAAGLKPGDVVRVRPGESVPGDGVIAAGNTSINQANITGESLPADKGLGDEVFGGTVNLTGVVEVRITKSGRDTTLGRVQDLVIQAQQTRTRGMQIAAQFAHWYTPVVLMIAGLVLVFTQDLNRVIAFLLVSCPCSLVVTTPTAMVAALSAAARLGVLVKNVADLELARKVTAIVFDKTGTLTTGNLSVAKLGPAEGVKPARLLEVASGLEQFSTHPVAKAVVELAKRTRVTPAGATDVREEPGKGVAGTLDGTRVLVGRESWLAEQGVDIANLQAPAPEGYSLLYVAAGGKVLGWIGLEDRTRPDAEAAMRELRDGGIRQLVMVTGDRWSVARRVAREMHCTDVQAEVLPEQKLRIVESLRQQGHVVAVVGDGVNDAPALAAGDLSLAMGAAGSDVAIHSASVALMNNSLNRIGFLIRLSRATANVITQGVVFSILYILIFGALSITGQIHPVVAAIIHASSSVVVILNSARLVRQGEELDAPVTPAPAKATPTVPESIRPALA